MYVVWILCKTGEEGYFVRYDDPVNWKAARSIYDARHFPTESSAKAIAKKLESDIVVEYTEVIKYNH